MNILFLAHTFEFIGTLLLGMIVMRVHWHISKIRKIDEGVLKIMNSERILGIIGIILIIAGYALNIIFDIS